MNSHNNEPLKRTPYHDQPITIVLKAIKQKLHRRMHCIECGMPLGEITDKVLMMYDGDLALEKYEPDELGIIEIHCKRSTCKQYYRIEVAKK